MSPKYLKDKDPWILAEDIPDIDFQFSQIWLSAFANELSLACGRNYKKIICFFRGLNLKFYYGEKDSDDFAKHLLRLLLGDSKFGTRLNSNIRKYSDQLKAMARKIEPKQLAKLSNAQLAKFYRELDALHTTLYAWGWLPNAVDMFHGNFTNYLKRELAKKVGENSVNATLVPMTTSPEKSIVQQEHESLLNLVAMQQAHAPAAKLKAAIEKHRDKYFYFKHLWVGKDGYDYNYYRKEVAKLAKQEDGKAMLRKEHQAMKEALQQRATIIKNLKLDKKLVKLFDVYAEFAVTKLYRRDAQLYWAYQMDFMFAALSKRLRIPFLHARFLMPQEVTESLMAGAVAPKLKKELAQRVKYCALYEEKGFEKIFYGKEAQRLESTIKVQDTADITELTGQVACLGKATGIVKIVNNPGDMKKMNQGDILVSIATNPDVVPAMKKAAAIVTEQGGITSHAAIVSRELGTPCVIGTKIATKVFKDGDKVEVDANKGVVRKL